jgi:hypothetical protein
VLGESVEFSDENISYCDSEINVETKNKNKKKIFHFGNSKAG